MSIDDAVQLVLHAFENGNNGDIFIQKSPAATINILRDAILSLKGKKNYEVQDIGTRHGEKLYEVLCSREEMLIAKEEDNFFRIPADNRDLNYKKFFDEGTSSLNQVDEYSSHNTNRLDLEQMKEILKKEIFKNT